MGVSVKTYLFYGAKFDYIKDDDEIIYEYCAENSIDIIWDGMVGEYTFIGKVVHSSDQYESMGIINLDKFIINDVLKEAIKDEINEINKIKKIFDEPPELNLWIFTHYS